VHRKRAGVISGTNILMHRMNKNSVQQQKERALKIYKTTTKRSSIDKATQQTKALVNLGEGSQCPKEWRIRP